MKTHPVKLSKLAKSETKESQLKKRVKYLQKQLELQDKQYRLQIENWHNYHALIRRITTEIRDGVNIEKILENVVQELSNVLDLEKCEIETYDDMQTLAKVRYAKISKFNNSTLSTRIIAEFPYIYQQLLEKKTLHSVEISPDNYQEIQIIAQMVCPIFDIHGNLGNIWLIKPSTEGFNDLEISLVEEIAKECAIAIRQSQLWEKTTAQLQEIEKRERHKHEFLKILAQELSKPITNIHLATQTLDTLITSSHLDQELLPQFLHILHNECGRENKLINDLLTLSNLQMTTETPQISTINLENCLNSIVASFRDVAFFQQQHLILDIPRKLPSIKANITDFQQIISELIHHSCQCTPPGESIFVATNLDAEVIELTVTYSGVEIPDNEIEKVFQPFYHFPKNEAWKNSTSGLELTLVKERVKRLNGKITVESFNQQITFTVKLPLYPVCEM